MGFLAKFGSQGARQLGAGQVPQFSVPARFADDRRNQVANKLAFAHRGGHQSARACSVARVCIDRRKSSRATGVLPVVAMIDSLRGW
jgi:hypothetical protein